MNVVRTPVSSNSDPISLAGRQDRNDANKGGGSDFSDTLGSIDKQRSAKQESADSSKSTERTQAAETAASAESTDTETVPANGEVASDGDVAAGEKLATDKSDEVASILPDLEFLPDTLDQLKSIKTTPDTTSARPDETQSATMPEGLGDLAKLVDALTKGAVVSDSKADDAVDTEQGDSDDQPVNDGNADAGGDILSLLAATAMTGNQVMNAQNASASPQPAANGPEDSIGSQPLGDDDISNTQGTSVSSVVRLQKQDVPAVDMHIDTNEDGSMKVDVSVASGNALDVVQVVESRRYLGLASTTNSAAITTAMTNDPDWARTLTDQMSGRPLVASTGEVVHTLKIQMSPVELGHVTAALKLVGDELSVHLTAHTLKGYAELQKDSSSILDALKSQGFTVDQVTVNLASGTDRQDSGTGNRQPTDPGQQGTQYGSQRGNDDKPQEQFYRQTGLSATEEGTGLDVTTQSETSPRGANARSGQLYL